MKIREFNDIHLFGVNPFMSADELISKATSSPYPVYMLGDILDIHNAKKEQLPNAFILLNLIAKRFPFILGNHENNAINADNFIYLENNSILLVHGDQQMWSKEKSDSFRQKEPGAGSIKRFFSRILDHMRHLLTVRPNSRLLEFIRQEKLRNPNLKTIIMGHSHPKYHVYFTAHGVYGVICPRGMSDLEIMPDGSVKELS